MSRQVGIASLIWGGSILLSRIIGLVREAVIGRVLGGGSEADVFWTAFVVPDFLNYLLAGAALSLVFIPIFNGHLAQGREDRAWQAFSAIANTLLLVLAVLVPLLWVAMPWLVAWVAPGFDEGQRAQLTLLCRIVLPAQIFHLVGGLLSATLQARDKHALPALAPLLYTGSIVVGGLVGGSAEGFAWGVLVGSVLGPFGLPLVGNLQHGLGWRPSLGFTHPDLRRYLWQSLPIMLGFSVVFVDDWVLRNQGSLLEEGAISSLTYAKTLMKVPMGVFGLATGAAAYPTLTRMFAKGEKAEGYALLSGAVKRMLVLALAAQVGLTVAGEEISRVIYGGRLLPGQHEQIGVALAVFGIGLWAWSAQNLIARGFYALGRTWLPTFIGSAVALLALPVYYGMRVSFGVWGLASATSIAITAYVIVLIVVLRRQLERTDDGFPAFFARMVPCVALGIGAGVGLEQVLALPHPLLQGFVIGTFGTVIYGIAAMAIGVPEVTEVTRLVTGKIRRRLRR